MESPQVSVLVACRNERASIAAFLESLAGQRCPDVAMECVIADGLSRDGTREYLAGYVSGLTPPSGVRILDNPVQTAASGLNLAFRASRGSIVLRMDAHTEYAHDYVAQCLCALAKTGARNVGGPALARGRGYWQKAVALAYRSPFFSGGARFHDPHYEGAVDTVPYGCWLRETLEALGGFDETLVRNQDDELNFRITKSGGVVWQSPAIRSWYYPRRNLVSLARQYYEYGYWKPAVIGKHGRPAHWRHMVPAASAAMLAALAAAAFFVPGARFALVAGLMMYGGGLMLASAALVRTREAARLLPALPLVFVAVHASYAGGFLTGLWKQRLRIPVLPVDNGPALAPEPQPQR